MTKDKLFREVISILKNLASGDCVEDIEALLRSADVEFKAELNEESCGGVRAALAVVDGYSHDTCYEAIVRDCGGVEVLRKGASEFDLAHLNRHFPREIPCAACGLLCIGEVEVALADASTVRVCEDCGGDGYELEDVREMIADRSAYQGQPVEGGRCMAPDTGHACDGEPASCHEPCPYFRTEVGATAPPPSMLSCPQSRGCGECAIPEGGFGPCKHEGDTACPGGGLVFPPPEHATPAFVEAFNKLPPCAGDCGVASASAPVTTKADLGCDDCVVRDYAPGDYGPYHELAQCAYDAFNAALPAFMKGQEAAMEGYQPTPWADLPEEQKDAWRAAVTCDLVIISSTVPVPRDPSKIEQELEQGPEDRLRGMPLDEDVLAALGFALVDIRKDDPPHREVQKSPSDPLWPLRWRKDGVEVFDMDTVGWHVEFDEHNGRHRYLWSRADASGNSSATVAEFLKVLAAVKSSPSADALDALQRSFEAREALSRQQEAGPRPTPEQELAELNADIDAMDLDSRSKDALRRVAEGAVRPREPRWHGEEVRQALDRQALEQAAVNPELDPYRQALERAKAAYNPEWSDMDPYGPERNPDAPPEPASDEDCWPSAVSYCAPFAHKGEKD